MKGRAIVCVAGFFLVTLAALADTPAQMHWSVQSTTIKTQHHEDGKLVEEFRAEYYLYYGNQASLDTEKTLNNQHVFASVYLIHPGPDVKMPFDAPHRWYLGTRLSRRLSPPTVPLFDEGIWKQIPGAVRSVLDAFGADDPELLLIWYDRHTGSVQVFFHPRYNQDRNYYRDRLGIITRYLSQRRVPA